VRHSSTLSLTLALDAVGGQRHAQAALTPVPTVQEAGWAPGPVRTGAENLASICIRSPDSPARSQSLHRLSYPGPTVPLMHRNVSTHSQFTPTSTSNSRASSKYPSQYKSVTCIRKTFTNSHCHFPIPAQSVTSVLLQRHKPNTSDMRTAAVVPQQTFVITDLSLSLPSLSLSPKTRPCTERPKPRAPKFHAACAWAHQNVKIQGHEH